MEDRMHYNLRVGGRLFCFVLFCFVLFCFVLFCFVLFCFCFCFIFASVFVVVLFWVFNRVDAEADVISSEKLPIYGWREDYDLLAGRRNFRQIFPIDGRIRARGFRRLSCASSQFHRD